MRGIFITFEGPDGSGKTTQINLLKEFLEANGHNVLIVREPGGTKIGEKIREVILDNDNKNMNSICEAMLYAASRAQLTHEVIEPALNEGTMVIADRFVDSSVVYQGNARGLGAKMITDINHYATDGLVPDITFLLKLSAEEGIRRKFKQKKLDRMENESMQFHNKVIEGYERLEGSDNRIITLNAEKPIDELQKDIRDNMMKFNL